MIRVAVCTPLPALRAGLRALISGDPDLQVAAAAANIEDLLSLLKDEGEPVEVIVATPEGAAGLEEDLLAGGAVEGPPPALLLVSDHAPEARRLAEIASKAGTRRAAWGAISPNASGEALQASIHALAEGLVTISPEIFEPRMLGEASLLYLPQAAVPALADPGAEDEIIEPLTPREREILGYLSQGLTNKQIALALHISEHTVKFHVSSVYSKMGASNRTEAVRKGARRGWVAL